MRQCTKFAQASSEGVPVFMPNGRIWGNEIKNFSRAGTAWKTLDPPNRGRGQPTGSTTRSDSGARHIDDETSSSPLGSWLEMTRR